ncbi:MAG TPA: alpha/beta fold hydrolase [Flavobacterium sp.]|nr:alpha/beta fold hydrolase [Flavobacterium sp.]
MKTVLELNKSILEITNKIREKHPELINRMNEKAVTIPYDESPEINAEILNAYYNSLVSLVDEYENNPSKREVFDKAKNLPLTEITPMELNNSFPDLMTEVNNTVISYNDIGEGSIPMLFIHGFPFDKSMWKVQLDALKLSNRVIAYDIRGFGKSKDETTPLSIDLFTEDLIAFMDNLKIEKAIICGLSMGGYIALNTIKKYQERLEALILCDTQCIADSPEAKEKRYATIEKIESEGKENFNENFIKNVFHPDSLVNKKEIVENLKNVVSANSKEIIVAGLTALAERSDSCSILKDIKIPTLIICGKDDITTPLAQSELMYKQIKGSSLKIIDNAAHVSNLEQPDEFNKHLQDFLDNLKFNS